MRRAIVAVASGAAAGGVLRLLVTQLVVAHAGAGSGYVGTLIVNLSGSLAIGAAIELVQADRRFTPFWTLFSITGLIGGYTTFSAFAYESVRLASQGRLVTALAYVAASVGLGIGAVSLGSAAARAALAAHRQRALR